MSRRWWAPAASTLAGLSVTAVAAAEAGTRGAGSGLLGTALVVGFLASGLIPLLLVRGQEASAALGAGVLLLNYTLRLAVAVLVLRVASRSDAVEPTWTAYAVIAAALAWAAGQTAAVLVPDGGSPDATPRSAGDEDHGGHDRAGHGPSGGAG
jgi:hypothetical protein